MAIPDNQRRPPLPTKNWCQKQQQRRPATNWCQKWDTGPFLIVKQLGPVNYQLQRLKRSVPFTAHVDKLKACLQNCPQSWLPEGAGHEPSEQPDPVEQVQLRPEIQTASGTGNETLPSEGPEPGSLASARPRRVIRPPIRFRGVYASDCASVYMVTGMERDGDKVCRVCGRRYWKIKALRSHLRLAHRPSHGSVEQHAVEISDHPASSCAESETAAPPVPGPVEPNVCSHPRRALDRVVVTVKSWLQNHPTVIWQPSASPQLRRVPGGGGTAGGCTASGYTDNESV